MPAAEQLGSVIEPANLNAWKDQQRLSDAFGDGPAYEVQQNELVHKDIVRCYEEDDMKMLGMFVAMMINRHFNEAK